MKRRVFLPALLLLLVATTIAASGAPVGAADGTGGRAMELPDACSVEATTYVRRSTDAENVELDETVVVSPPNVDVVQPLEAGDSFTCTLTIRSRRSTTARYELEPLGVVGSRAKDLRFELVDRSDDRWDSTAGGWIEPAVREVIIPPRGVVEVPVRVTVPADPPTGGVYGAIDVVARTKVSAGKTALGIESHAASIVLLDVGGEGAPDLSLRDVEAPRLRWDREAWPITGEVENDGTLHARASGRVRIRSIFGNEVATLPLEGHTILPGGRQPIEATWRSVPWLGFYRYDVRVSGDGDDPSVATADGWFVALPPWWVLAIVAGVVLVLLVRWLHRRAHRWDDELDDDSGDDGHDDPGDFDFDLAERQLRE